MKVLIFGATGMIGQGVLRECLQAADVELVGTIGRAPTGRKHERLREIMHQDLFDYAPVADQLRGFDACFFCLGVASAGMSESDYTRLTHDLTVAAAGTLVRLNPDMTFVYVSGAGTDSSEQGRAMWARVKGRTENALRRLPFKAVYLFRPGIIQALHGERSRTRLYRWSYVVAGPILPVLRRVFPGMILTTADMGRAMLAVTRNGAPRAVLEVRDIRALAASAPDGKPAHA